MVAEKRDATGEHGYRKGPGESEIANQAEFDGAKTAQHKALATPEIMSTRKIAAPKGARRLPGSPRPGMFSSTIDQIGNPFAPQVNGTGSVNGMNMASPFPAFGQQPQQTQQQNTTNSPNFSMNSSSSSFNFANPSQTGNNPFMNSNQPQSEQQLSNQAQNGNSKAFSFTFGAGSSSDNNAKPNNTFNFGSTTANNPFAGLSQPSTSSSGGLFSATPTSHSISFPPSQGTGSSGFGSTSSNGSQGNIFGAFGNIGQDQGFGAPANNTSQPSNSLFQHQNTDTSRQAEEQVANPFQHVQKSGDLFQQQPSQRATGNPFDQTGNHNQQPAIPENKTTSSDSMQVSPPTSPSRANGGQRSIIDVMTNGDQAQQASKPKIFGNVQEKEEAQSQNPTFSSNQEQNSTISLSDKPLFSAFGASNSQRLESEPSVTSSVPQQSLPGFSGFVQNKAQAHAVPENGHPEKPANEASDKGSTLAGHAASPFRSGLSDPFTKGESVASPATAPSIPKFEAPSFKSGPFSNPFENVAPTNPPTSAAPKFEQPSFTSGPFSNPFSKSASGTPQPSSAFQLGSGLSEFQSTSKLLEKSNGSAEQPSSTPKADKTLFDPGVSFNSLSRNQTSAFATPEKSSASSEAPLVSQFKLNSEQPASFVQSSTASKPSLSSSTGTAKPVETETSKSTPKYRFGFEEAFSAPPTNIFGMSSPVSKPFEGFSVKDKGNAESSSFITSEQTSLTPMEPSDETPSQAVAYGVESLNARQHQLYEAQRALRSLNYGFLRAIATLDPLKDQSDMMRAYLSAADKIKKGVQSGTKRKQEDGTLVTPKRSRNEDEAGHILASEQKSTTAHLFQRIVNDNTTPLKQNSSFSGLKTPTSGPESRSLFADLTADAPATEPPHPNAGRSLFDRIDKPATEAKKPAFSFFPATPTSSDDAAPGDQTWKNDSPIRFGVFQTNQPQFLFAGSAPDSATTSRATSPGAGDGGMTSEAESTTSNTAEDAEKPLDQVDLTAVDSNSEILYETDNARGSNIDPETKSWVVRGQGSLRILKDKDSGLITVLLRTVPSGRIVFNARLVKGLPYRVAGKNAVKLPILDATGKLETWYVRFKNQDLADKFAESCEKWKESAS